MRYVFANNNKNQLKSGKLILNNGDTTTFKYEELQPRSYTVESSIIESVDRITALATIRTSRNLGASNNDTIELEEGTKLTIKSMTPEIDNAKSRYGKNTKRWVINLG